MFISEILFLIQKTLNLVLRKLQNSALYQCGRISYFNKLVIDLLFEVDTGIRVTFKR